MPAFSVAIAPRVVPSWRVWSMRDAGDDADRRVDDVGRIEPSAQPHLEHHGLGLEASEVQEPHRRRDLEEGRAPVAKVRVVDVEPLDHRADLVDQGDQLVRRGRAAVDAVAFLQPVQVGRAIEARTDPRGGQGCGHHRGRRALALGPGDVDHLQAEVRIAQSADQPPHPPEPEFGRDPRHPHPLVVQAAVQVIETFLIIPGHGDQPSTAAWAAGDAGASIDAIRALSSASERSLVQ